MANTAKASRKIRYVHVAEDGARGAVLRGPMDWTACNVGFTFEAGEEGKQYLDIVIYNDVWYACKTSHTKTASNYPGSTAANQQNLWSQCNSIDFIATRLLLASYAQVDFLKGQSIRVGNGSDVCGYFGAPTNGGAILYTGAAIESGATFAVYRNGSARWGTANGQMIEIDPATKRLNVYDSSGKLCAIHSGDTLDYSKVGTETGSGTSSSVTAASMKKTLSGVKTETTNLATGTATKDGTLKVTVPGFVLSCIGNLPPNDGTTLMSAYKAELHLEILIGNTVVYSSMIAHIDSNNTGNISSNQVSATAQVSMPAGSAYTVRLRYVSHLESTGSSIFSASGNASISFETSNKVCHYGSNGWYISSSNQNYAYFILDSAGKLHAKIVSGGAVKFNTD